MGGSPSWLSSFGLSSLDTFRYLGDGKKPGKSTMGKRDKAAFTDTMACLTRIGVTEDMQKKVFGYVAAVLHLGNVEFVTKIQEEGDASEPATEVKPGKSIESLATACSLLGLSVDDVTAAITSRKITVGEQTMRKSQSVEQSIDKRDALAKLTYSSLFLWLVDKLNCTISADESGKAPSSPASSPANSPSASPPVGSSRTASKSSVFGFIGVLDIYGFEHFDTNGFEQLLINYANESLQRHFNRHLFELEQEEYEREGVDWTYVTFNDNRPCLELLEGGSGKMGIVQTLDDAWGGMGSGEEKDQKFVSTLHQMFGGRNNNGCKHECYDTPRVNFDKQFSVFHYAGKVKYTASGFVEKNIESLSNELKDLGSMSCIDLTKVVFEVARKMSGEAERESQQKKERNLANRRRSRIRGDSVASQFKFSLQKLMLQLESTSPHYIRCVKPNLKKQASFFDSGEVLRQLRYAGMMETIRIRSEGYSLREEHGSFYDKFKLLLSSNEAEDGSIELLVSCISKRLNVSMSDWQIGHSKVFLRRTLANKLERLSYLKVTTSARTIQNLFVRMRIINAANKIVLWSQGRVHATRRWRIKTAAVTIGAAWRMKVCHEKMQAMKFLAVKVQSQVRRRNAKMVVDRMRDPFAGFTYVDLNEMVISKEKELDLVIEKREFDKAGTIEADLVKLSAARDKVKPMTRSILEQEIAEVKKLLDECVEKRQFEKCGGYQEQVDALIAKRADYPTIEELRAEVGRVEDLVKRGIENRDFSSAGQRQKELDEAKLRLEGALKIEESFAAVAVEGSKEAAEIASNNVASASRAELEVKIIALQKEVDIFVEQKDFAKAEEKQSLLKVKEGQRQILLSCKEMTLQLVELKRKCDEYVAAKQFSKADEMQQNIAKMDAAYKIEKAKEVEHNMISEVIEKPKSRPVLGIINAATGSGSGSGSGSVRAGNGIPDKENVSGNTRMTLVKPKPPIGMMTKKVMKAKTAEATRPVSKLRPKKPLIKGSDDSIVDVASFLAAKRGDAALITDSNGGLAGIITDNDICRRVVAQSLDTKESVSAVMTANPKCVAMNDDAMDALAMMIENHFRHLPVVDEGGSVVGLLDIAKCLYDAISKLEKTGSKSENKVDESLKAMTANLDSVGGAQAAALQQLLGPLMKQAFGEQSSIPTLRSLLKNKTPVVVKPGATVREAGCMMAEARKAALVVEDGELVGIFTPKDLMSRAVAKESVLELTAVSSVMTPNPESVLPDVTVLEALQTMHEYKFLSLPVCESDGSIVGLVDVMDLIIGCGGSEGWRSIFSSIAADGGDDDDDDGTASVQSSLRAPPSTLRMVGKNRNGSQLSKYDALPDSPGQSIAPSDFTRNTMVGEEFVFKVVDSGGNTHRIRTESNNVAKLLKVVGDKLGKDADQLTLKFKDDDGDVVVISCDDSLRDAVESAKNCGEKNLKLNVEVTESLGSKDNFTGGSDPVNTSFFEGEDAAQKIALLGGGVLVAGVLVVTAFMRGKK